MSLENHVVRFKIAKELWAAGWKKETLYYYVKVEVADERYRVMSKIMLDALTKKDGVKSYAAPMITEIVSEFPDKVSMFKSGTGWVCKTRKYEDEGSIYMFQFKIQDACARVWIWLRERKLVIKENKNVAPKTK